jgi:hypothetical protein
MIRVKLHLGHVILAAALVLTTHQLVVQDEQNPAQYFTVWDNAGCAFRAMHSASPLRYLQGPDLQRTPEVDRPACRMHA